ncbi:energy transducer TonB [Prosthecochloris sp. N3]|uniref:Energy transducer TonB n=2 Tax=Prosthecochloris ethylica TaxID=2743976 RepID=A0ABR9XPU4_9CHLB|nr:energy transducer TonB [Prosthecochloris ethylica]MBF0636061.1 energy transducer TonB [Prosthecochloris ethylica]
MSLEQMHKGAPERAGRWSLGRGYLDTDRLRGISYGNLSLRRQSHLYLAHGVIVALLLLVAFWGVSANWDRLAGVLGFGAERDGSEREYVAITHAVQLPPPPPIDRPAPPKAPKTPAQPVAPPKVETPPNVGKVKQVKKEEAPPEQTLATQEEIREVVQKQPGAGDEGSGGVAGGIGDGPVFVPVEKMPAFRRQVRPRYPERARRAGIEGKVFVSVLISEEGKPVKAQIMKREPVDRMVFDKAAIEAVMKSRYTPGIQNGKPVKVWLTLPIRFTLR